ncbi:unnamed protein product [Closterium sp. NIES-64]|nr:unnamed protein product [Closterium sp. NIES-64]CAI5995330.1 unnamed protein product [Closterium sp. NIES-64]
MPITCSRYVQPLFTLPHPLKVGATVKACLSGDIDTACEGIRDHFALGYAAFDIITTLFRIVKNYDMPEFLKLEFIRVSRLSFAMQGGQMGAQGLRGLDLFALGYAASDTIMTLFTIVKNYDMPEFLKLEFIRGVRGLDLFALGYAASDTIMTLFRIVKNYDMPEFLKLEFIRVSRLSFASARIVKNYDMPEFLKLEFIKVSRQLGAKGCRWVHRRGDREGVDLFALRYAASDIITTLFRIVKNYDMPEVFA